MRGIARRLHRNGGAGKPGGQRASGYQRIERGGNMANKGCVKRACFRHIGATSHFAGDAPVRWQLQGFCEEEGERG